MKTFFCILLGALALVAAPDGNVSGKWTGSFNIVRSNGTKESTAILLLKQTGSEITGSVGPNEGEQHTITKGKIAGNKITLTAEDGGRTITFNLVLSADRITGDANMANDEEKVTAKLDVTRAK
jgi:hypothetical protein